MKPYGNKYSLKKKFPYESKKISVKNLKLIHKIFNTVNISLLIIIFILYFLSFNSQRKWSNTYKILTKTKINNNNLIDYVSKTEEFYISELESLNTSKKTKPKDLIYLNKTILKRENFFDKKLIHIINGIQDSRYQRGY